MHELNFAKLAKKINKCISLENTKYLKAGCYIVSVAYGVHGAQRQGEGMMSNVSTSMKSQPHQHLHLKMSQDRSSYIKLIFSCWTGESAILGFPWQFYQPFTALGLIRVTQSDSCWSQRNLLWNKSIHLTHMVMGLNKRSDLYRVG